MLDQLESSYDCSNAGSDLQSLQAELELLKRSSSNDKASQDNMNRLENQIHFIKNKCDIKP